MPTPIIGLCDVNNFYVSAECVFRPELVGKPVVALSNNDGCAVSRSAEAKALGIKMGAAWHQIRKEFGDQVIAVSSRYELYADMSQRVMAILADACPAASVYSIDEAFLHCDGMREIEAFGRMLRARIKQWTGLPVCFGFSTTHTRAKLANHVAKKRAEHGGVFYLESLSPAAQDALLAEIPVGEVWGVGKRIEARLEAMGIHTVRDLQMTDPRAIRREFSVIVERTVMELQGIRCLPFEAVSAAQQQIMRSRSFGRAVHTFEELREAVLSYGSRAAEKLRAQRALTGAVLVFIQTNPFDPRAPQYSGSRTVPLPAATDDTLAIGRAAVAGLRRIYRPGFAYKKAGVMLMDLSQAGQHQAGLLEDPAARDRRARLNGALDQVNARFGRGALALAGAGIEKSVSARRAHLSPRFTTSWDELPRCR